MDNPGVYTLAALGITAALSAQAQTPITGLDGMSAVTLEAALAYGSGGTTCAAVVQTSFDGGTTWRDVARFEFTTASAVKIANLQANGAKAIASYSALSTETVLDGVLGDRLRVVVTSTGTYVNTTLSVRASAR
jgi:hypothetical protein